MRTNSLLRIPCRLNDHRDGIGIFLQGLLALLDPSLERVSLLVREGHLLASSDDVEGVDRSLDLLS